MGNISSRDGASFFHYPSSLLRGDDTAVEDLEPIIRDIIDNDLNRTSARGSGFNGGSSSNSSNSNNNSNNNNVGSSDEIMARVNEKKSNYLTSNQQHERSGSTSNLLPNTSSTAEDDARTEKKLSPEDFASWTHNNRITKLVVERNLVYTCSYDKTICAWDRETGACKQVFQGHDKQVICILIHNDILYSGSYDRTVRAWDTKTGECIKIYTGNENWVLALAIANGLLYCAGYEKVINVFDIETGRKLRTFKWTEKHKGHTQRIQDMVVYDEVLFTASADCTIRAWDLLSGECVGSPIICRDPIFHIEVSNGILFANQPRDVLCWDIRGFKANEKPAKLMPFIESSVFNVQGDVLILWNRIYRVFEFWHVPTYTLLHNEKLPNTKLISNLVCNNGDLYFCSKNQIGHLKVDAPMVPGEYGYRPPYFQYKELLNYGIDVLLESATKVARAIDYLHEEQVLQNCATLDEKIEQLTACLQRGGAPPSRKAEKSIIIAPPPPAAAQDDDYYDTTTEVNSDSLSISTNAASPQLTNNNNNNEIDLSNNKAQAVSGGGATIKFQLYVNAPNSGNSNNNDTSIYTEDEMALDFETRTEIFYQRLRQPPQPQSPQNNNGMMPGGMVVPLPITVRRNTMVVDAFKWFSQFQSQDFKRPMFIFIPDEPGLDMGGLTREFYMVMSREIMNPNNALFNRSGVNQTAHPNPASFVNEEHLAYFKFVGQLIGKAIYDLNLMDTHFTRPVFKMMVGQPICYEDLQYVDPVMFRSMEALLRSDDMTRGASSSLFSLNFVAEVNDFGMNNTHQLLDDGENVVVTEDNKVHFVELYAKWRLVECVRPQMESLLEGLYSVIPRAYLRLFTGEELELLLCGSPQIDVGDWKRNTEYQGGFTAESSSVRWFWQMVDEMSEVQRSKLLQFATGTSCLPAEGFAALDYKFTLVLLKNKSAATLPVARTCFNRLEFPEYDSYEMLKDRFMRSIELGLDGGFHLI